MPTPMQATAQNFTQGDNHLLSTSFATASMVGSQDIIGMPVFFGPVGHLTNGWKGKVKWLTVGTLWESRPYWRLDMLAPRPAVREGESEK